MRTILDLSDFTDDGDFMNAAARRYFSIDYLYPHQRMVVANILESAGILRTEYDDFRPRQIIILPTGAGKSLCFMLPALFLPGVTLVIFPLLSLIADQKRRIDSAGLASAVLKGGQTTEERKSVWRGIERNDFHFLLTNPETLAREDVLDGLRNQRISHIVVDETHTVSEWVC